MCISLKRPASIGLLTVMLFSCNNNDDLERAPDITGFYPSSGLVGSPVTIYGNHFIPPVAPEEGVGPHINTSIIEFNGLPAEAEYVYQDSIDKQRINTTVPIGATTGVITVTANGRTTTSLDPFVVTVPQYLPNVTVSTASNYGGVDVDVDTDGNFYVTNTSYFRVV